MVMDRVLFQIRYVISNLTVKRLRRDNFENTGELDKAQVYGMLANLSGSSDQAVEYLHLARDAAVAAENSPATWLLNELSLRIVRRESELAQQIFEQVRTHHLEEPGVSENLYKILESYGMLPQGSQAMPNPAGLATPVATAPAQAAESQTLWTPDTDAATTSDSTQKPKESKLWVPGMD